jgi:hypothetical protein
MTDQLDSRATGMVAAVMDDNEHPMRRPLTTPAEGFPAVETDESGTDQAELSSVETDGDDLSDTASISIPTPEVLDDPAAVAELVAAHSPAGEGDDGYPEAPERGSLDDDDLVPLVGRHTDDTATIDLIGILQAQMALRTREAERFAAWEEHMRQIGTAEALGEIERTRLHFTGVIPVQRPGSITAPAAPVPLPSAPPSTTDADSVEAPRAVNADDHGTGSPTVITAGSAPTADNIVAIDTAHDERARDQEILEHDEPALGATATTDAEPSASSSAGRRILVPILSIVAALVVVAAVVLTAVGSSLVVAAALSALGVVAAAWIGIVFARLALRPRGSGGSAPVTARTAWALVAGLVIGAAIGEGLVRTTVQALSWQGYLLRLVDVEGFHALLSVVAGLVAALVVAFVIVVLIDRSQQAEPSAK